MKLTLLGFEFESRFSPTIETVIRYRNWQRKVKHLKCRAFHNTAWATHEDHPNDRWYVCQDCKDTWLGPKHPGDGDTSLK